MLVHSSGAYDALSVTDLATSLKMEQALRGQHLDRLRISYDNLGTYSLVFGIHQGDALLFFSV